jgi:hypothetical protein
MPRLTTESVNFFQDDTVPETAETAETHETDETAETHETRSTTGAPAALKRV